MKQIYMYRLFHAYLVCIRNTPVNRDDSRANGVAQGVIQIFMSEFPMHTKIACIHNLLTHYFALHSMGHKYRAHHIKAMKSLVGRVSDTIPSRCNV